MRIKVKSIAVLSIAFLILSSLVLFTIINGAIAEEAGAAQVVSHSSYIKYESYREFFSGRTYKGDFLHVVGEIQNVIEENIEIEKITPIFYDENGTVIEVDPIKNSMSPLKILKPGQKSPFEIILLDVMATITVANYEFLVESTITTEEPPMLEIPTHSSYMSTYFNALGEVENIGVENIEDVRVFATFYDEQGTVIGVDYTLAEIGGTNILVSGQKSPFSLSNYDREEINEKIQSYRLCAWGTITFKEPYGEFQIVTHNAEIEFGRYYKISGEVKNVGETNATFVKVVATFSDSNGRIIVSGYGYVRVDDLNMSDPDYSAPDLKSGQTGSFQVTLWDEELFSKVVSYTLQVQCQEVSDIRLSNLETVPKFAEAGEEITITLDAKNHGEVSGTRTVTLTINEVVESTKEVTLSGEQTCNVTFTVTKQENGTYTAKVPGMEDKFWVTAPLPTKSATPTLPPESDTLKLPWGNVTVLMVAAIIGGCSVIGIGLYFGLRRKKE